MPVSIIVAGDIFDTGTPPSYAREMYFDFISQLQSRKCQLVIVAGNHDSVAMIAESKSILKQLNTHVIPNVSSDIEAQVFTLKSLKNGSEVVVCGIPFIRPRDVVTSRSGQSAENKQIALQNAIEAHYQALFEKAQSLSNDAGGLSIIATGHLTTVGASVSDSVRDIYIGTLEAFPANAFPNFDYIALGHIHRSQKVAKSSHIRYSGSPIPLSFDEATSQKSVLLVEIGANEPLIVKEHPIPCFQPLLMLKSTMESFVDDLEKAVTTFLEKHHLDDEQKIWLDIEISSLDYLQNLQSKLETLIKDLPVEVLLVRRSKESRRSMPQNQKKVTLEELSLAEVFEAKLEQSFDHTDDADGDKQKARLKVLFDQMLEEVTTPVEAGIETTVRKQSIKPEKDIEEVEPIKLEENKQESLF